MRALVLSGGGAKGAYQVGVLQKWLHDDKRVYDIFCGVSVGALNSGFLAQFGTGYEGESFAELVSIWCTISNDAVYRKRSWWEILTKKPPSLYDSAPLAALVRSRLSKPMLTASRKLLRVGAVNLQTGKYHLFTERCKFPHEALLASSSFPVMLSPVWLEGDLWTDGGLRTVTPLQAAIDCGATEIDVVMCSSPGVAGDFTRKPTFIDVALRAIDVMGDQIVEDDIRGVQLTNRALAAGADFADDSPKRSISLRIVRPVAPLTDNSLDFSQTKVQAMIQRGYADACRYG